MELMKILIIDGEETSRNYLKMKLRSDGCSIDLAASSKVGLIKAWEDRPDFIVMDPALSDFHGMEMISRLRQDRLTSFTKVITLGNAIERSEIDDLLQGGCNEYLVKSNQAFESLCWIKYPTKYSKCSGANKSLEAFYYDI